MSALAPGAAAGTAPVRPRASGLTGTATLVRLAVRRHRLLVPVSVLALVGVVAGSARATFALYPDASQAVGAFRSTLDNPAIVAVYGPVSSLTLDTLATFKTVLLGAAFLCLLAAVLVRRHTRAEEEEGRLELLGSGVVGRRAPLTAAVLVATTTVLATAALTTVGAVAVGLDRAGSVALGVAWAAAGLTWVGVAAVSAQLTETARGATGFALGSLAAAYLVRALGDTAPDGPLRALTWLSPLGWAEKVGAYGDNRVAVGVLGLLAYAALLLVAYALLDRRDLGAGVLPSRPGAATGSVDGVGRLTRRLARSTVVGWTLAFVVVGAVVGSLAGSVESFLDSPATARLLRTMGGDRGSIIDTFYATELHTLAVAAAALGVTLVTRMRSEETSGRLELLLAGRVTRVGWARAHLADALAATSLVVSVAALVAGLLDGRRTGDTAGSVGRLLVAGLATLPAVWVCVAVAVLLVGAAPRRTGLAWAALVAFLVLGEFGPLLGLPGWLSGLSPFGHLPDLPGGQATAAPLLALTVVAAALVAVGLTGLRRRDLG